MDYHLCIVGGGLSGLALATFLGHLRPELRLLVLEQDGRAGGLLESHREDGYLAERGPHGFLDNCAESRELLRLAELGQQAVYAPLSRFGRYLCLDGRLQLIPQTPGKILRAPILSFMNKLQVLGDLRRPYLDGEPSVAKWVEYRFGKAMLPFADAALTGTYAGDIERLSIDGVMPGIRALEKKHGSVIRGLLGRMRERRRDKSTERNKKMPAMTNFTNGMAMLPQTLAARLAARDSLSLNTPVHALEREDKRWLLRCADGTITCSQLALALPIWQSLTLLQSLAAECPPPAVLVPESRIATVLLGFDERAEIPFGFGYLAPEQEKRFALGALFSSHMFPDRAPAGKHLLEALVGGRRHPEYLEMDDKELINRVFQDLRQLMPLPEPCFSAVLRPRSGIPQFEAGYTQLRNWRERVQASMPGLLICGFGWNGIGLNDMIKEAFRLATALVEQKTPGLGDDEVKAVYF